MNSPDHPHNVVGRIATASTYWIPDGETILLGLVEENKRKKLKEIISEIELD